MTGPNCRLLLNHVRATIALIWLCACQTHSVARAAYLELVGAPAATACNGAPPGKLRLQGLDASARALVSGVELCAGTPVRRELPPGLYTLSWQAALPRAELEASEASPLHGPTIVSLFSGQITLVRVQLEATQPSVCSSSS